MKSWLVYVGFAVGAFNLLGNPFSNLTFDAALQQANQSHKIVLLDFYTTWCGPCNLMDKRTWTDAGVVKLLEEKTVALQIDAEQQTNLADRFRIDAYPTVVLVKADGMELDRLVGFRDSKTFTADFQAALNGKDSVARAKDRLAASGTNDPMLRMQLARSLAEKGEDARALDEYLWCFDHGAEVSPAFVGVRLSFLLSEIKSLGTRYPPAQKALEDRRDAARAKTLSGTIDRSSALDLVGLNEALGQPGDTLAVYDQLPAGSPVRTLLGGRLADQFLAAKRYTDMLAGQDPEAIFARTVETINYMIDSLGTKSPQKEMYEQSYRQSAVKSGAGYFEALAGAKRNDEARQLAKQILKFDPSPATHATLSAAAERAGNAELAAYVKQ